MLLNLARNEPSGVPRKAVSREVHQWRRCTTKPSRGGDWGSCWPRGSWVWHRCRCWRKTHTHFTRTRKQSPFLLCPLLAKLNVVPAGKGKIIKGPTFTSQSRLWVNLELSGYQWLTCTWGNHPRLLPLLIFLVQSVPHPAELALKTSGLLHSYIIFCVLTGLLLGSSHSSSPSPCFQGHCP